MISVFRVDSPMISTDSHHSAVCILLDRYEYSGDLNLGMPSSTEFNFCKADFSALNNYISSIYWNETLNCLSLEDMYTQLIDSLSVGFTSFVPKKTRRSNADPPWFSNSLRRLKNSRNKAHRRFLKLGGTQRRNTFVQLRREFQFLHRFLYRNYVWSVEQDLKSNSKRFWVYINKSRKSQIVKKY